MIIQMDGVEYGAHYIDVVLAHGRVEMNVGKRGNTRRTSYSRMTRKQALALAGALQAAAWQLEDEC